MKLTESQLVHLHELHIGALERRVVELVDERDMLKNALDKEAHKVDELLHLVSKPQLPKAMLIMEGKI